MREWEIQIYWSEEDKLYIAEIPELKGFLQTERLGRKLYIMLK